MESILELDKELFLFLNALHADWLDPIMFWLTKTIVWLPLYLFLLYLSIKEYKKQTWVVLVGIGLTILLADQATSGLMKPFFERLRPSRDPSLEGLVHLVNGYKGGKYGFASGHAANTFGTATFFFLVFRNKHTWIKWIFIWAALMTYTRIYLGVHYPGDILVGATIGCSMGWIGYRVYSFLYTKINTPLSD
jgi:undecaprenyl-diphosphatase